MLRGDRRQSQIAPSGGAFARGVRRHPPPGFGTRDASLPTCPRTPPRCQPPTRRPATRAAPRRCWRPCTPSRGKKSSAAAAPARWTSAGSHTSPEGSRRGRTTKASVCLDAQPEAARCSAASSESACSPARRRGEEHAPHLGLVPEHRPRDPVHHQPHPVRERQLLGELAARDAGGHRRVPVEVEHGVRRAAQRRLRRAARRRARSASAGQRMACIHTIHLGKRTQKRVPQRAV